LDNGNGDKDDNGNGLNNVTNNYPCYGHCGGNGNGYDTISGCDKGK
jgi:hypothetical protein